MLALAAAQGASRAGAAEWGAIVAGESTMEDVRARYGPPTRAAKKKVDGRETDEWVYEGTRAPAGMVRMTVEFGLEASKGFRADVVRAFRLEPKPGIFDRDSVRLGWGEPTGISKPGQPLSYFYEEGLFVQFAEDGSTVESMLFAPPQPTAGLGGARRPWRPSRPHRRPSPMSVVTFPGLSGRAWL